jgi:hypothetical protein
VKTMAEVLTAHGEWRYTNGAGTDIVCRACGEPVGNVAAHQADALTAAGFGPVKAAAAPEIRYVDLTTGEKNVLDEVVAFNATVHLEAMDSNHWWMAITSGGETVHVNLYTKRAKIIANAEADQ